MTQINIKIIIAGLIGLIAVIGFWNFFQTDSQNQSGFSARSEVEEIPVRPGEVNLYYFWLAGCPACAAQDRWLEDKLETYPELQVHKFNISTNSRLLAELSQAYQVPVQAQGLVPANFIGDEFIIGFDKDSLEAAIETCLIDDCPDPKTKLGY